MDSASPMPRTWRGVVARDKRKHERIRQHLLQEIALGKLRPGDMLPPEHDLAELMGVSRTTIRQSLGDLEQEGQIRRVRGKGTFVSEQASSAMPADAAGIALIIPDMGSTYYASMLSAFEQAVHESGRSALVCSSNNQIDKQASQVLRLMDQGAAGVVLNPCGSGLTPPYQVRMLQKSGIPVVLLHNPIDGVHAPLVRLSREEVGSLAGELISSAGHRCAAIVSSGSRDSLGPFRGEFRKQLIKNGGDLPDSHVICGGMEHFSEAEYSEREHCVERIFRRVLELPDRPTAVFVSFESVAEIAYLVLQKMGLRIPEDISLVTFGSTRREGAITQRLTSITVDESAAIRRAVQLLNEIRQGKRPMNDSEQVSMSYGVSHGETLLTLSR